MCLFLVSEYIVMAPHIKAKGRTGKLAHVCMLISPTLTTRRFPQSPLHLMLSDRVSHGTSLSFQISWWSVKSWILTFFPGTEVTGTHHHTPGFHVDAAD